MRKKFAIFQVSPRRLLSLLLIHFFFALVVPNIDGTSAFQTAKDLNKDIFEGGQPYIRPYQLIHRCSEKHVQMGLNRSIDAKGPRNSPFTALTFSSVPDGKGGITIRGNLVKKYLCFSKKGRLTYRSNINYKNFLQCTFLEQPHAGYIKLQSRANDSWYVGFNKRGKSLRGYAMRNRRRRRKCFMFTKLELNSDPKIRHRQHKQIFFRRNLNTSKFQMQVRGNR